MLVKTCYFEWLISLTTFRWVKATLTKLIVATANYLELSCQNQHMLKPTTHLHNIVFKHSKRVDSHWVVGDFDRVRLGKLTFAVVSPGINLVELFESTYLLVLLGKLPQYSKSKV